MTSGFAVIIPARNEAGVIAQTLATLTRDVDWTTTALIVVCNGCTDDTAAIARRTAPAATVIEAGPVGKAGAINLGLEVARHDDVLIVDADVRIGWDSLRALAAALADGSADAVSPVAAFDTSGSSFAVRAYYRVYREHPYQHRGVGGSGVYGFSRRARAYLAPFPAVHGDDGYVRRAVPAERQRRLSVDADGRPVVSGVVAPATLRALVALEARWRRGDAQLRKLTVDRGGGDRLPRHVKPLDLAVYLLIKVAGRGLALVPRRAWYQDRSSRRPN